MRFDKAGRALIREVECAIVAGAPRKFVVASASPEAKYLSCAADTLSVIRHAANTFKPPYGFPDFIARVVPPASPDACLEGGDGSSVRALRFSTRLLTSPSNSASDFTRLAQVSLTQHPCDLGYVTHEIVISRVIGASLQALQDRRDFVQLVKDTSLQFRNQTYSLTPHPLQKGDVA